MQIDLHISQATAMKLTWARLNTLTDVDAFMHLLMHAQDITFDERIALETAAVNALEFTKRVQVGDFDYVDSCELQESVLRYILYYPASPTFLLDITPKYKWSIYQVSYLLDNVLDNIKDYVLQERQDIELEYGFDLKPRINNNFDDLFYVSK